jgi:hypothetical protein
MFLKPLLKYSGVNHRQTVQNVLVFFWRVHALEIVKIVDYFGIIWNILKYLWIILWIMLEYLGILAECYAAAVTLRSAFSMIFFP